MKQSSYSGVCRDLECICKAPQRAGLVGASWQLLREWLRGPFRLPMSLCPLARKVISFLLKLFVPSVVLYLPTTALRGYN